MLKLFPPESLTRIAVVGAGAVGCYFGGMLARGGSPVTLIGRPEHVDAIRRDGLFMDRLTFKESVAVTASTEMSAAQDCDLVLFCVKTLDTEGAARELAPFLAGNAVVLSMQNGVDNVERIRSATGIEAVPAVVYVAASMSAPGWVKHAGRGDLLIGDIKRSSRRHDLAAIASLFAAAQVPCVVSAEIEVELWKKMMMNCAYNAISALSQVKYGSILENELTREVLQEAVREGVAVARAEGVTLSEDATIAAALALGGKMTEARSSTAQDLARHKRTEMDSLNGYIVRRGREHGIETPVNKTLYALVKQLEES